VSELLELALVFLRIGTLAFGGGSAILPELHREVVKAPGWLTEREFLDGFALGQLTPGPGRLRVSSRPYSNACRS
jgi:chromate transporter